MELKKVAQWLLDNKYALLVNNQIVLTSKIQIELFGVAKEVAIIAPASQVITTQKIASVDQKKTIWNEFITRAEIPHRVKAADGGEYTVRQYSPSAVDRLIKIIKTDGIDYDRLIASTKHYYKTVSYKALLSNYLLKDIWKDEYDNYKPNSRTPDGSSRWED